MARLPILQTQDVIEVLEKLGFQVIGQDGSHGRLRHQDEKVVTVPVHPGQDISRGLVRKTLRDAEITPVEFLEELNA
jgi:predicted RNA binding protein YcfA (HicA-like mRNA interferase family)